MRDHYFKQQKGDLLIITKKNSDPNHNYIDEKSAQCPFEEYLILKWTYLSKACDKVNGDVITPTLQLKFSNRADAKS